MNIVMSLDQKGSYNAPSPDIRSTVTDNGAILYFHGKIFHCNRVGAQIWSRLAEGQSIEAIIEGICCQFGAERERVAADADEYMTNLNGQGSLV